MNDEMMKSIIISAAELATVSDVANLTADRVIALTGGHGMVTMGIYTAVNVIVEEILGGGDIVLKNTNVRNLPLEAILSRTIEAAKLTGADGANAALIAAFCMYLAGSKAQVGIPAGNRKLGATARMLAGVDRGGVAIIPTPKMNNKISGFAAVQAIYQAMIDKKLSPVDGHKLMPFVGGGPVYGHSALGEDVVWPAMAVNGAKIGTQAMLDSMAGASMPVHPYTAAALGAAAILEIIHPDAEVAESEGEYGKINSAYLVGKTAAETAGLPAKLHLRITGEEFDTARLIGDVGLILKDVGAPSVIGMMAFEEIFSIFEENIAGFSGTPLNSPLGHVAAYALIGMKVLLANGGQIAEAAKAIAADKTNYSFDPETSLLAINIMSRKAHEIKSGLVTDTLLAATEPAKAKAVHQKAVYAWEALRKGQSLADVVKQLDTERLNRVEVNAQKLLTAMMGQPTSVKVLKIACGARRRSPIAKKYLSFDPLFDLRISVGDKTADFPGFVHDIIPKYCLGQCDDLGWAIVPGAAVVCELVLGGSNILNVVVPVAVAAAMGSPVKEAADSAVKAAFLTAAIPGLQGPATKVGTLAKAIVDCSTNA